MKPQLLPGHFIWNVYQILKKKILRRIMIKIKQSKNLCMKFNWKDYKKQNQDISHTGQILAKNFSETICHQNQNNICKCSTKKVGHKGKINSSIGSKAK